MCYLPMPFARRARFVLANDGDRDYSQSVAYGIDRETGEQYAREKSRLHCSWRRSNPVKDGLHTILDAKGRGHYVGNILQVHTRFAGWWGEGDAIFQLDGKTITHAPGTEDEYGACWGFGNTYSYFESGYLQNDKGNNRMGVGNRDAISLLGILSSGLLSILIVFLFPSLVPVSVPRPCFRPSNASTLSYAASDRLKTQVGYSGDVSALIGWMGPVQRSVQGG